MFSTSNLSTDEKLTRTKIQMYKRSPFFSYILLHMKLKEDVNNILPVPSMGVDPSGTLWWRKEFVDKLSEKELLGVICHETLHIALQHLERAKGRENMIFNIANDLVINDLLLQNEFTLPQKGLIPDKYTHSFKIKGHEIKDLDKRSSEDVYDEIYPLIPKTYIYALGNMGIGKNDNSKQQGRGKDGKSPGKLSGKDQEQVENLKGFDNHIYGKENKDKDNEQDRIQSDRQQKWKQIIAEAAQLAKQQGQLPAGLERTIDDLLDSKINWKSKLYKYVVSQIIFDYSWSTPSRKSAALGIYLPNTLKQSVHIVVSVDTSGSISQEELKEFLSEMVAITESFPNINMDVIVCDAEVHETHKIDSTNVNDICSLTFSGGGGTSHVPIDKYIIEHILDCKIVLHFTDGYTDFTENGNNLPYQTMWVLTKNSIERSAIPYGEIIKIDE